LLGGVSPVRKSDVNADHRKTVHREKESAYVRFVLEPLETQVTEAGRIESKCYGRLPIIFDVQSKHYASAVDVSCGNV
jgi:hypothetical protein